MSQRPTDPGRPQGEPTHYLPLWFRTGPVGCLLDNGGRFVCYSNEAHSRGAIPAGRVTVPPEAHSTVPMSSSVTVTLERLTDVLERTGWNASPSEVAAEAFSIMLDEADQ